MSQRTETISKSHDSGNLRIGDHWKAITIIALSQSNPLKAVAELVENSIDARAKTIVITRGKEKGQHYLRVKDDGEGVRQNADGAPDFHYVATHVCDSIKRRLKTQGMRGLQGEFGIGLLSFWTLGEELLLTSSGEDGRAHQMHLCKGDPSYRITQRPALFPEPGTEVLIKGILPGIKNFSGEKIQWYLAAELRDRIRHSGVSIRVVDRTARAEFKVEPRQFEGRLLHELDGALPPQSEIYAELYLHAHSSANAVSLYRSGTRVLENLAQFEAFARLPWTSGYVQGIIDAPYLNLTPGTRLGVRRLSRTSSGRKRSGRAAMCCARCRARSRRRCSHYRPRNTTDSICIGAKASAGREHPRKQQRAKRPRQTIKRSRWRHLATPKPRNRNASSSNTRVRCFRWSFRRHRASLKSAARARYGRSRVIERDDRWNRI